MVIALVPDLVNIYSDDSYLSCRTPAWLAPADREIRHPGSRDEDSNGSPLTACGDDIPDDCLCETEMSKQSPRAKTDPWMDSPEEPEGRLLRRPA